MTAGETQGFWATGLQQKKDIEFYICSKQVELCEPGMPGYLTSIVPTTQNKKVGSAKGSWQVPADENGGTYTVTASNQNPNHGKPHNATTTFQVVAAVHTVVTVSSDPVFQGQDETFAATGFDYQHGDGQVTFTVVEKGETSPVWSGSGQVSFAGKAGATWQDIADSVEPGTYTVTASQNGRPEATANFTIKAAVHTVVTVSSDPVFPGQDETFAATGFDYQQGDRQVTFTVTTAQGKQIWSGTDEVNLDGKAAATWQNIADSYQVGTYTVTARQTDTLIATANFTLGTQTLSASDQSVDPQQKETFTAQHFNASTPVTFTVMNQATRYVYSAGTTPAKDDGTAVEPWQVPATAPSGVYTVTAQGSNGNQHATTTLTIDAPPSIDLAASASSSDLTKDGVPDLGDVIVIKAKLTNTGGTSLSNVTASARSQSCPQPTTLAVGADTTCQFTVPVTADDLSAAKATITVTGTGEFQSSSVSDSDTVKVPLTRPFVLSAYPRLVSPGGTETLTAYGFLPGDQVVFTIWGGDHEVVTQTVTADPSTGIATYVQPITAQSPLVGTYTAIAKHDQDQTNTVQYTVSAAPKLSTAAKITVVDANRDHVQDLGDLLQITGTLTNTGNVTLSDVRATTDLTTQPMRCQGRGDLRVGADRTCQISVPLTLAQLQAGKVATEVSGMATFQQDPVRGNGDAAVELKRSAIVQATPSKVLAGNGETFAASGYLPGDKLTYTVTNAQGQTVRTLSDYVPGSGHGSVRWLVPTGQEPGLYKVTVSGPIGVASDLFRVLPTPHLTEVVKATFTDTNNDGVRAFGDDVTTTVNLTNVGNVSVQDLALTETVVASPSASSDVEKVLCQDTSPLAPNQSRLCTITAPVTRAELNAGQATITVQTVGDAEQTRADAKVEAQTLLDINQTRALTVNSSPVEQGRQVQFAALGFFPGNTVTFTVTHAGSTAGTLTGTVTPSDAVSAAWSVPADAAPGEYSVTAHEPGGQATATFTVTAKSTPTPPTPPTPPAPPSGGGTSGGSATGGGGGTGHGPGTAPATTRASVTGLLPHTGAELLWPMLAMAALIAIGGVLAAVRRRSLS